MLLTLLCPSPLSLADAFLLMLLRTPLLLFMFLSFPLLLSLPPIPYFPLCLQFCFPYLPVTFLFKEFLFFPYSVFWSYFPFLQFIVFVPHLHTNSPLCSFSLKKKKGIIKNFTKQKEKRKEAGKRSIRQKKKKPTQNKTKPKQIDEQNKKQWSSFGLASCSWAWAHHRMRLVDKPSDTSLEKTEFCCCQ